MTKTNTQRTSNNESNLKSLLCELTRTSLGPRVAMKKENKTLVKLDSSHLKAHFRERIKTEKENYFFNLPLFGLAPG